MSETTSDGEIGSQAHRHCEPARTYAIVVGIERYEAGQEWDLGGPATDATRFASWLSGRGVPHNNIFVFLSSQNAASPGAALPSNIPVKQARRELVYEMITRILPACSGDLLWLFWAGHGVLDRDDHLRVLCADATSDDKRNVDVPSLLTALRSDLYPGIPHQIGVFDACQVYAERLQLATTLPSGDFPSGRRLPGRQQFIMYAASPGQVADDQGSAQGGLFSRSVLEELAAIADDWPPKMDMIAARLTERFTKLRALGQAEQTPSWFWWRPWEGGQRVLADSSEGFSALASTAAPSPPKDASPAAPVSVRQALNRLCDLLAVSISQDEAKRIVRGSGTDVTEAWWTASPRAFWDAALAESEAGGRVEKLLAGADHVFGTSSEWQEAKAQYRAAQAGSRRSRGRYLIAADVTLSATASPYTEPMRALSEKLDRIEPGIFCDLRIKADSLKAARAAVCSVDPLIEALAAAAAGETRTRDRFELQQLEGQLRRHCAVVSRTLIALAGVSSGTAAEPLCRDLTRTRDALLAIGNRAIFLMT